MFEKYLSLVKEAENSETINRLTTEFMRGSMDLPPREQIRLLEELNAAGSKRRAELWELQQAKLDRENEKYLSNLKEESAKNLEHSLNILAKNLGVKR